jgi:phage FluMu gp28-like protein
VPYTEAVRRLIWFSTRFESVVVIRHDKTGVGSAIDDLMAHTDLPHEGVTWTSSIKNEMVARLMTSFEQREIKIPRWSSLVTELEQYEISVTPTGAMSYGAPTGKHDDCVSSLLMANAALLEYGDKTLEVRYVNEIGEVVAPKDGLEAYYQSLVEDDED